MFQPLRTKHCRDCKRCVRTHDHHCPWIGNCVGEGNRFFFLLFMFLQAFELLLFFIEGCQGVDVMDLYPALVLGIFIIALIFMMVICLLSFHCWLVLSNTTTWENISRRRISYLMHLPEESGSPFSKT